jgi:hypothetical protein
MERRRPLFEAALEVHSQAWDLWLEYCRQEMQVSTASMDPNLLLFSGLSASQKGFPFWRVLEEAGLMLFEAALQVRSQLWLRGWRSGVGENL